MILCFPFFLLFLVLLSVMQYFLGVPFLRVLVLHLSSSILSLASTSVIFFTSYILFCVIFASSLLPPILFIHSSPFFVSFGFFFDLPNFLYSLSFFCILSFCLTSPASFFLPAPFTLRPLPTSSPPPHPLLSFLPPPALSRGPSPFTPPPSPPPSSASFSGVHYQLLMDFPFKVRSKQFVFFPLYTSR